jgi:hypothetical protein
MRPFMTTRAEGLISEFHSGAFLSICAHSSGPYSDFSAFTKWVACLRHNQVSTVKSFRRREGTFVSRTRMDSCAKFA